MSDRFIKLETVNRQITHYTKVIFFIIILCIYPIFSCVYAEDLKGTISIGGTGNALEVFRELGEAFRKAHPGVNIVVLPSLGSGGGIKAIIEGALDLGLSARQLKDAERQKGAVATDFARTPFVFVLSGRSTPIKLTLKDIAKLYSGDTLSWADGTPVRIILRPETDSDTGLLMGMSAEMKDAVQKAMSKEGMPLAMSDQDNADMLIKVPGSFGAATLGQIIPEKRPLAVVTLDGVVPGIKTLSEGNYPYSKSLFLITGPGINTQTKSFIEFLNSAEGKTILKENGFLTVSGK